MHVLVLIGSNRQGSVTQALAKAAIAELPANTTSTIYSGLADIPFYNEALEKNPPESVVSLREAISKADALIVATPEYNGSISAVLKNAIDWVSRPFGAGAIKGKATLVLAATPSPNGAKWAREDLLKILKVAGALPLEEHFGHANASAGIQDEHRDILGRLVDQLTTDA